MPKLTAGVKRFLGFTLKPSENLHNVWMNEDKPGDPFICISHRGVWTITVSVYKNRFEAEGSTERKARLNFARKISSTKEAVGLIDGWAKRK
jgi:hypothetical protein